LQGYSHFLKSGDDDGYDEWFQFSKCFNDDVVMYARTIASLEEMAALDRNEWRF
jgi:hypothetical protein